MGSGTSSAVTDNPAAFFAYQVVSHYYNAIKLALSDNVNEADLFSDEKVLLEYLNKMFLSCQNCKDLSISDCGVPAVIYFFYSSMTQEDKDIFHQQLMEAASALCARKSKKSDYSLSFSGTEMDTKAEKDASEIMRGGNVNDNEEHNPILRSPNFENQFDHWCLRKYGKWLKFMGAGCYMYINSLSREMVSVKPDDFIEEETVVCSSDDVQPERDPANGLPIVALNDLVNEIDRIVDELNKTPLIIDTSPTQNVKTFFSYKGFLEVFLLSHFSRSEILMYFSSFQDTSVLIVPFAKSGLKRNDVVEKCRKKLVGALKSGGTFVLYLGSCSVEHADWKTKLCKKVFIFLIS